MARPSRRRRGAITIEDVARAAGVSAMTVVARHQPGQAMCATSTRAAVLEAIDTLNYSPNTAARSLAAGEATHIGLLYANPSAAYLSQFLIGALHAARNAGAHLVIESCESEDADEQAEVTRRFANSDVEGVILPPPFPNRSRSWSSWTRCEHSGRHRRHGRAARCEPQRAHRRFRRGAGDDPLSARSRPPPTSASSRAIPIISPAHDRFARLLRRARPKPVSICERRRSSRAISAIARDLPRASGCCHDRNVPTAIFASNDDMAAADRQRCPPPRPRRARRSQHRRFRRHRARHQRLARADHGQAADRSDGRSRARIADRRSCAAAAPALRTSSPSGCSATR